MMWHQISRWILYKGSTQFCETVSPANTPRVCYSSPNTVNIAVMASLRRVTPSLASKSVKLRVQSAESVVARMIRSFSGSKNDIAVNDVCDSLRRGCNWDALSTKFNSVELTDFLVDKVLLQLKEPNDAKRALGFFHWSAQTKNFEHGIRSYCITVHILVGARLLMDARALLESILKKSMGNVSRFSVAESLIDSYEVTSSSPLVFDLLVQGYAKLRMVEIAYDVCGYLDEHGFSLSLKSFNTLIHVVQNSDQLCLAWKIYEHMVVRRTYPNEVTIRIMINCLCKEGKLQKFVDMVDRIHGKKCSPSVIVNASLIFRILEEGRIEEGMVLLKRLLQKNMILDTIAYSLIVMTKVGVGDLDSAREVFEEMLKRGFRANSFVYTTFVGACCKVGNIEEANRLFQEMEDMNLDPYNETFDLLIRGCAKAGRVEESRIYCEKLMERGLVPSLLTFNEMVKVISENGDIKQANALLTPLLEKGFLPDENTYSNLINGYGKQGDIQEVLKLYYEMEYRSLSPSCLAFTSIISGLCERGKLEEAEIFLERMNDSNVAPSEKIYEALIIGYIEKGNKTRALQLYDRLLLKGLKLGSHVVEVLK